MGNINEFKFVSNSLGMLPKEGTAAYSTDDGKLKVWLLEDPTRHEQGVCQVIVEYLGVDFSAQGFAGCSTFSLKQHSPARIWDLLGDAATYVALTAVSEEERVAFTRCIFELALHLPNSSRLTPQNIREWVLTHSKHPDRYLKDDFFYHGVLKSLRGTNITPLKFTNGDLTYEAHTTFFGGTRAAFEIKFSDESRGLEIRNHFAVPFGKDWRPGLEKMLNDHKSVLSQISRYR